MAQNRGELPGESDIQITHVVAEQEIEHSFVTVYNGKGKRVNSKIYL
jgi:hypothetical protein